MSRCAGAVAYCPPYPAGELAPLADLLRTRVEARHPLPGAAVADGPGGGALAAFLAAPHDDTAAARAVVACREALLGLATEAPVVVAVDDLDRAAPALRRFLRQLHVAASDRGLPLAVVTTYGSGSADPLPAPGTRRIPLRPLGPLETGRLLRHLLGRAGRPAALAARLLPLAGGSPAVATAYALTDPADEPAGVPAAVRRLVDARMDRLDGTHRAVLMAGAARGGPVAAATVEAMLGWPAGRATPVLRALAVAGLLRPAATGGWTVEPLVARVAAHRLSRAVRADFARRLRAASQGGDIGAPDAVADGDRVAARAGLRAVGVTGTPGAGADGGHAAARAAGAGAGRQPARVPEDTAAGFAPAAGTGVPTRDTDERGICPLGAGRSRRSGGGARPAPVPPDRGDALRAVPRLPARADRRRPAISRRGPGGGPSRYPEPRRGPRGWTARGDEPGPAGTRRGSPHDRDVRVGAGTGPLRPGRSPAGQHEGDGRGRRRGVSRGRSCGCGPGTPPPPRRRVAP